MSDVQESALNTLTTWSSPSSNCRGSQSYINLLQLLRHKRWSYCNDILHFLFISKYKVLNILTEFEKNHLILAVTAVGAARPPLHHHNKMADENRNVLVDQVDNMNNLNDKKNFVCGVVEGFYGRPWTPEQRKDLFVKQQKWGMNAYLYAPKDDYKHRAYWRELYTVEEAEHLTTLIAEAKRHNVMFYYAISPGLDITYSSQKEMAALKRKLEQVAQMGCNAFAILFDDIDPEMSSADKEVFQSFAHAQVSVTNDIFTHLGQPKFMFCPTQYCSTRAVPTVLTSEYLTTLGNKLAPAVDIMWTGPKVISKVLTIEHIREVSEVMKRPPVIWDNLHANDYDQARVFLGPYCGRSPDLIPLLRGVMTNPNCEYGPNFVAIHTLAQWSKSSTISTTENNDAVSADIKLETEGDDTSDDCPSNLPPNAYHPRKIIVIFLMEICILKMLHFQVYISVVGIIESTSISDLVDSEPSTSADNNISLSSTISTDNSFNGQQLTLDEQTHVAEAMWSALVAEHNVAFSTSDHATKIFHKMFPDSSIAAG
ncbi:unnamed protein product, partial [Meganyctiphanes norvegica]